MKHHRLLLAALSLSLLAAPALADTVTLKSSDTLTGTILRITPDTVDLKTNFAGLLHIQRDKVKTLRSDTKVTIVNPQGESHAAYVSPIPEATGWRESDAAAPPPGVIPHRHPRHSRHCLTESRLPRSRTLVPPHRPALEKPAHPRRPRHHRQHRFHQHRRPGQFQIHRKTSRNHPQDRRRLRHH